MLSNILETLMMLCFGSAWPLAIRKSYLSKHNGNKSLAFLYVVLVGYVFGIIHRIIELPNGKYVFIAYIINTCFVLTELAIYYRNRYFENSRKG